ncbi:MAG: ABC transporter ATP-binding protein [Chthoniobacterales bacterium]
MISITIENLVKKFGDNIALNHLSLKILPGELFFLLGPSGCGKTTLLRNVAGFYTPEEGKVLFDQEDVTHLPPHQRHTGMVFQSYALWPHMTVAKNVAFGLEQLKISNAEITARVHESLASVRMEEYASRKIAQLSGGQQQRVALARALVIRPRVLLLDEPLSNLDAKLRLEMRTEIRRVCKEFKLTAIYVTHDQKEALSIADRMAILHQGRVAQIGTPEEIYRNPHSCVVADFIGETNFLKGKVLSLNANTAEVETDCGRFEGILPEPEWRPDAGESVTLSIRPEAWRLHEENTSINTIQGEIGETIYLGEVAQYQFLHKGSPLKIFELNPRPSERPPGRKLFAQVDRQDVVILRQ